ncbi:hypothetical protein B0H34DRAFT_720124 [Crassisporium funariophilum]|nr:hypothetical protein B0H34DRAFT_720124 [Crassisporium funariophilum]
MRKLCDGAASTCSCGISITIMIGKWSVFVGLDLGSTSHCIIDPVRLLVLKTLLGCEYLFERICCNVGTPFGSVISIPNSPSRLISPAAIAIAVFVNRWVSALLSHIGWCLLKLPAHTMWSVSCMYMLPALSCRYCRNSVSVFEWVQELYTLNIVSLPYGPVNWIAVMLLVPGILMIFRDLVSISLLTHMADLTGASFSRCSAGYTC